MTVNGNQVTIQLPIAYSGNADSSALESQLNAAIANQWSGTFGKYNVTTTVTANPAWYNLTSASNSISLVQNPPQSQQVGACTSPTSCISGGNSGVWFQPGQGDPTWEATHESGHLMGLPDEYTSTDVNGERVTTPDPGYESNVMGAYGQTGVTEGQITEIINANTPWYTKAWNAITGFFSGSGASSADSGSSGQAAAGGYLIYPNMPNNNNLSAAYSKP